MCGICGVIGIESNEASESVVRRMMAAMIHRGPDEEGILLASPVAAGMQRLSIVDLAGGSQPVWNEAGTLAVVYNGEIYNFSESARGARIRRPQISHALRYRSRRPRLRGVGRALRRAPARNVCVRGRRNAAGPQRPGRARLPRPRPHGHQAALLRARGWQIVFASEVRTLLASGCVPARISASAIPAYLLFGSVCEPLTLIEGVVSLPPGHSMSVLAAAPVRVPYPVRYWDAPRAAPEPPASPANHVRALLEDAVAHASRRRCSRRSVPEQRARFHGHRRARQPRPRWNPHVHRRVSPTPNSAKPKLRAAPPTVSGPSTPS